MAQSQVLEKFQQNSFESGYGANGAIKDNHYADTLHWIVVAQVNESNMRRKQREMLVNPSPQRLFFVDIYIKFHVLNG